jgi:hypothetical protein
MKLLIKWEFSLEIHLAFVEYEKASNKVKRQQNFNTPKENNITYQIYYWKYIENLYK